LWFDEDQRTNTIRQMFKRLNYVFKFFTTNPYLVGRTYVFSQGINKHALPIIKKEIPINCLFTQKK
jgi:hypothetical protein